MALFADLKPRPSLSSILDKAFTGGKIGETAKAVQTFVNLPTEQRQALLDLATKKQITKPQTQPMLKSIQQKLQGPLTKQAAQRVVEQEAAKAKVAPIKYAGTQLRAPIMGDVAGTYYKQQVQPEITGAITAPVPYATQKLLNVLRKPKPEDVQREDTYNQYMQAAEGAYIPKLIPDAVGKLGVGVESFRQNVERPVLGAINRQIQKVPEIARPIEGIKENFNQMTEGIGDLLFGEDKATRAGGLAKIGISGLMGYATVPVAIFTALEATPWDTAIGKATAPLKFLSKGLQGMKENLIPAFNEINKRYAPDWFKPWGEKVAIPLASLGMDIVVYSKGMKALGQGKKAFTDFLKQPEAPAFMSKLKQGFQQYVAERQLGYGIRDISGQPTSQKFMGEKLPRAGIEKPSELPKRETTRAQEILNEEIAYLNSSGKQGVTQGNLMRDAEGKVVGRFGRQSNNPQWYRDFYKEKGRAPSQKEIRQLAIRRLKQGYEAEGLPPNEEFLNLEKTVLNELEIGRQAKIQSQEKILSQPPDISVENNIKNLRQGIDTPREQAKKTVELVQSLKPSSEGIIPPSATKEIANIEGSVNKKVNLLDWFRTPDRVLHKIGLGKEAELLKKKYNDYLDDLPKEINKITDWWVEVKDIKNSPKNIFQYLDGQAIELSPKELKVANEMKSYLKTWAEKLKLPEDKRIASYITHIFEEGFIKKEFDPDLAKIIADRIPGSVYDPFLESRLGKHGYVEDVFRALDAYTKRATRKFHMDEALESIQKASESIDLDSYKYVQSLTAGINLRPTQLDNYLDNLIKQSPIGYKLGVRPTTRISRSLRQAVYRGTLGLNIGSAVKNLTQGVNTYSQLGEKYTALGYVKTMREIFTRGGELEKVGVLRDNFIQDRQISSTKKVLEKIDTGLWSVFQLAEKINRGAAYFGAKAQALKKGATEAEATKAGVEMARKTHFTFGRVDTPAALQSDLVKTLTQFQSFNIKQTEFLAEMIKNKQFVGLARWTAANLVIIATVGSLFGYTLEDTIPFSGVLSGRTKLGETPPIQLGSSLIGAIMNAPDKYGKVRTTSQKLKDIFSKLKPFIPAGVQIAKTTDSLQAILDRGRVKSASGKTVNFTIPTKKYSEVLRALLFGKYQTKAGQEYLKKIQGKSTPKKTTGLFSNLKPR